MVLNAHQMQMQMIHGGECTRTVVADAVGEVVQAKEKSDAKLEGGRRQYLGKACEPVGAQQQVQPGEGCC